MANPNNAGIVGTSDVMEWYDRNAPTHFWSVTDSKGRFIFSNVENDENISREKLEANIRAAESQGIEATYTLNIYPKVPKCGYYSKRDEAMLVCVFRPTAFNPISYQPMNQMGYPGQPNLMTEISALRSEIAALKMQQEIDDQDDDDDEPEENFLSGLMKSPQIQTMILSQLSSLFAPGQKVTHVAGIQQTETMANETEIENEERIYNAVERLKLVDEHLASDLELLCEMAETDKFQFNFLLKMLRK
jgi:hypothetical protein